MLQNIGLGSKFKRSYSQLQGINNAACEKEETQQITVFYLFILLDSMQQCQLKKKKGKILYVVYKFIGTQW